MNYTESLEYLNRISALGSKPGLSRITELLDRLGRPDRNLQFIHVTGTNGKGSTCAFLSSILTASGIKTGMFTSPYIDSVKEQFLINGLSISDEELANCLTEVSLRADSMADHPTEFEVLVATAMVYFSRSSCELVVLEVGFGGAGDATNAIDPPLIAMFTPISIDHVKLFGSTTEDIAREKSGIIKEGTTVITSRQPEGALEVLRNRAASCSAPVYIVDCELIQEPASISSSGDYYADNYNNSELIGESVAISSSGDYCTGTFTSCELIDASVAINNSIKCHADRNGRVGNGTVPGYTMPELIMGGIDHPAFDNIYMKLKGSYQRSNAALAIGAAYALADMGYSITEDSIRRGIEDAAWPGRFETVCGEPLFIVDGAHNESGIDALIDSIEEAGLSRLIVINGILRDKPYDYMIGRIAPYTETTYTVTVPNPRTMPASELAEIYKSHGISAMACDTIEEAVELAASRGAAEGNAILAFGSLYFIGIVRRLAEKTGSLDR